MAAARLRVSVASPDGQETATRGLGPWLTRIAPAAARGDVTIALVSDRRIRALNRQFRGTDHATDVLSFPSGERGFLGDIVIAAGVARRQAREAGHTLQTEFRVLALHGLLHLLGYDHEIDEEAEEMEQLETELLAGLGIPNPYADHERRLS